MMILLWFTLVSPAHADTLLFDRTKNLQFIFKEYRHLNLFAGGGNRTEKAAYDSIQEILKKNKGFKMGKLEGNPASYFCEKGVHGENVTLKDLAENEYAICKFKIGVMVDAWDLFRLKK